MPLVMAPDAAAAAATCQLFGSDHKWPNCSECEFFRDSAAGGRATDSTLDRTETDLPFEDRVIQWPLVYIFVLI